MHKHAQDVAEAEARAIRHEEPPTQSGRQPCPAMLSACQTPFNPPSHNPTLRRCPYRVVRAIFKGRVKHDRALAVQPC